MRYYSLNRKAPDVNFEEAVIRGIAPDRGLYFPSEIPQFPESFWKELKHHPIIEIAQSLLKPFTGGSIPESNLEQILSETLDFDFPLVALQENLFALELYHGPTMAFKDVGARFMARCLGYFLRNSEEEVTVLVATSGDTGGAVANGFFQVPGVRVVILYPEGKVSAIQEKQLTSLGHNISALRVKGSFDDCQRMVKQAFLDTEITHKVKLTSANSINVARWIPQMLYYVIALRALNGDNKALVFSVPSGNFGNICAGMLAHKMGMPCTQFIASTNINDTVPRFMRGEGYQPSLTKTTISNAMDVSDPSNFIRILNLFDENKDSLNQIFTSISFTDRQTREAMIRLLKDFGYIADPHGAVGYLGLSDYLKQHPSATGIFLETAHPIKFKQEVEMCLDLELSIPQQIKKVIDAEGFAIPVSDYQDVKSYLLRT